MSALKGACAFGQSGGPTAVINSSACGVIETALASADITGVYAMENGIRGVLNDRLFDMRKEEASELALLRTTPGAAFGSCRYKLKDASADDADYRRIVEVFKKHGIRYFFYNGGNDSMDTCERISRYCESAGYECRVVGVPKTIDNDLALTDHCPGYGSAAKYVAASVAEVALDVRVYNPSSIVIIEIMGRNAGWLAASAALASLTGAGADLVYLPEAPFSTDRFLESAERIFKERGSCVAAVSEGIRDENGRFITDGFASSDGKDAFGHSQMGGLARPLSALVKERLGIKTRGIELSLLQRCAAHCASRADVDEAYLVGKAAVEYALSGGSARMAALERVSHEPYRCAVSFQPLDRVANLEKRFPAEWITPDGSGIAQPYFDYALPLITGESRPPFENGLPRFARLRKITAG